MISQLTPKIKVTATSTCSNGYSIEFELSQISTSEQTVPKENNQSVQLGSTSIGYVHV